MLGRQKIFSNRVSEAVLFISAFGIITGILAFGRWGFLSAFCFLVLGAVSCVLVFSKKLRYASIALVFFILACAGGLRVSLVPEQPVFEKTKTAVEGIVASYPERRDGSVRYDLETRKIGNEEMLQPIHLLVEAERFPEARYGDRILAEGTLETPGVIEDETGRSFDYGAYLRSQGFAGRMSFAKIAIVEARSKAGMRSALYSIRERFSYGIERALPEPQAGFLKGVILGEKHAAGEEIEDAFKAAGLSHLVVLSGYNIMIVVTVVFFVSRRFVPRIAPYVALVAVLLFILMTGGEAPSIRAGLMAGVMLLGVILRRDYIAGRALALIAIGYALFDPLGATSLSFLLSAVATFAIIYAAPLIEDHSHLVPERFGLREAFATTVAAQIFVTPLLLRSIGEIPALSILANILVVPLMPLAMGLGALAAFAGTLGFFPMIFSFPAYLVLSYVVAIAKLFAATPLSFSLPFFPAALAWALCALLIAYFLRSGGKAVVSS